MHAVSTNQIADILHLNNKGDYRHNAKYLQFGWLKQRAYFLYFQYDRANINVKRKKARRDIQNI